ncbi:MAG: ATP-binding protein, partial [Chloroflexota bacterium]
FTVGGRRYGVYGHDWRTVPPLAWLELLAQRETSLNHSSSGAQPPATPLVVLSQPDFAAAVRQALHELRTGQVQALQGNPLLRSRLVGEQAGANADETGRAVTLQKSIRAAAERLQATPRQEKLYKALYHTYFFPAPTQEQAAELLDLPFSTFRRHLKAGVDYLTEMLWQQELGTGEK